MEQKKNTQIALDVEEMRSLRRIGLDTFDASMCWIKEPNEKDLRLVTHDEYCYEMECLGAVPAYTLEDIMMKIQGSVNFNPLTSWEYFVKKKDHKCLKKGIHCWGDTPLQAAYFALYSMQKLYPKEVKILNRSLISHEYGN